MFLEQCCVTSFLLLFGSQRTMLIAWQPRSWLPFLWWDNKSFFYLVTDKQKQNAKFKQKDARKRSLNSTAKRNMNVNDVCFVFTMLLALWQLGSCTCCISLAWRRKSESRTEFTGWSVPTKFQIDGGHCKWIDHLWEPKMSAQSTYLPPFLTLEPDFFIPHQCPQVWWKN